MRRFQLSLLGLGVAASVFMASGTTVPNAAAKGKPGGGGEVAKEIPVCITFDDALGDGVQSDGLGAYCDADANKKVTAIVGENFSIVLAGNNSRKTSAGRTFELEPQRPDHVCLQCQGRRQPAERRCASR